MDRNTAESITSLAREVDRHFGKIIWLLDNVPDEPNREELHKAVYRLVLDMHENLVLPIARQYPDLHPDDPERFREALERTKGQR